MLPRTLLARSSTADGAELELWQHGNDFAIRTAAGELMNSRRHGSEQLLASLALEALGKRERPRILVGGLGCGYTLRATLERVGPAAQIVVSELSSAVVEWNRTFLAHLTDRCLDDPRVEARVGDVAVELERAAPGFDLILLDVDNGPSAFTRAGNARLYGEAGVQRMRAALRPAGIVGIWSAGADAAFEARLRAADLEVTEHRVRARGAAGGSRHLIWLARRTRL